MSFDITQLDPALQTLYTQWITQCEQEGLFLRGIQGWRDPLYQDQLHAQGISPLTGATSLHCCVDANGKPASKAFDFGCFTPNGAYITNGNDPAYFRAGQIAKSLKLVWGGNFVHPRPDPDHIQLA